jgi:hypothetical protein
MAQQQQDVTRRNPTADDAYGRAAAAGLPGLAAGRPGGQLVVEVGRPEPRDSLVDILERVLDKGVVIAGDISINLLDIELLTIKIRLLIASVDKAKEMGIDWWARDPQLSGKAQHDQGSPGKKRRGSLPGQDDRDRHSLEDENRDLRDRIGQLESKIDALIDRGLPEPGRKAAAKPRVGPRRSGGRK